jgi:hypothetical protein
MASLGDIIPFDYMLKGRHLKLLNTYDPFTKLQPGMTGTIKYTFDNLGIRCISVNRNSNPKSVLMLLEGIHKYEILD